ncbi:MAG: carboxypeptidase regulatory-like domain-containing protein [Archangium sp.]|nr:carboxypeptidase regulatory-like domain-containing protein [Archangium sp.]
MGRRRWLGFLVLVAAAAFFGWALLAPREAVEPPTSGAQRNVDGGPAVPSTGTLTVSSSPQPAPGSTPADSVFTVLVTADGAPVPDVQLSASAQQPTSSAWRPSWDPPLLQRTDARGRAEFAAGAGTWVLTAVKQGFATATLDVVKPAGERVTPVELRLEHGNDLRGLALDLKGLAVVPARILATPLGELSTRRRSAPMGVAETTVDAKGAFHFTALASGWWRLEGDAEGSGRAEPRLIRLPTDEVVKLRFRRSGFLEGVVVQADGGVAPRALVVVGGADGNEALEASATGTFSVERMPGSYRLSAQYAGLVGTADQVAQVHAGDTTATRIVVTGKGGTLAGTVRRDDGVPVEGALVLASPHNEDGLCGQATTGADGTFSISGYPRGTYDLDAEAKGLMKATERGFFVAEGMTQQAELVLSRPGRVKGLVETPTGAPLSARVTLHSMRRSFADRQAVADSAGHFVFEDVPPGAAFVTAARTPDEHSLGFDVKVKPGSTSEVKVTVFDSVALEVTLDRSRCTPATDVTVVTTEPNMSQKGVKRMVPVGTDRVMFLLSPGTWQVAAWDTDARNCTLKRALQVALEPGRVPAPVRLVLGPSDETFEVTVLETDGHPAPFANVTAKSRAGGIWATAADADGVAQLGFPSDTGVTVTASKQGRSAQVTGLRRALGHVTLTLLPAARIHLRLSGVSGMTRIEAELEGDLFTDELRATGSEVWLDEMPVGRVRLKAMSADETSAGRVRVVTTSGQTTEASLRLEPVGRVSGKVTVPGVIMVLLISKTEGLQVVPRPDGTFASDPIPAGEYTARVECPTCGGLVPRPFTLAPGAQVELSLP